MSGSIYTLTGNFSGGLEDERNGSTIEGAGHWIRGNNDCPIGPPPLFACQAAYNDTFALELSGVSNVDIVQLVLNGTATVVSDSTNITIRSMSDLAGENLSTPLFLQASAEVLVENCTLVGEVPPNATSHRAPNQAGGPGLPTPAPNLGNPDLSIAAGTGIEVANSSLVGGEVGLWAVEVTGLSLDSDSLLANVTGYTFPPLLACMPPILVAAGLFTEINGLSARGVVLGDPYHSSTQCYDVPEALLIQESENVTVFQSSVVHSDTIGVYLLLCVNSTVSEFLASGQPMGVGIQLYLDTEFSLLMNIISNGAAGTVAYEVSESENGAIENNQANSTGTGAFLYDDYQVALSSNSFAADFSGATNLTEDDLCSIVGNDFSGNASRGGTGLAIVNSTRLQIDDNSIGGWGSPSVAAVSAFDLRGSTLSGNIASGAPVGIHLTGSFDDTLEGNLVQLSGSAPGDAAIELNDSGRMVIDYNRLLLGRVGILGFGGGDDLIVGNNLSFDTQAGLLWHEFENLTIDSNVVVDDGDGIDLVDGAGYTLVGDTSSNLEYPCGTCVGVFLEQVSDGAITASNFSTMNIGIYAVYVLNLTVTTSDFFNAGYGVLAGYATNLSVSHNRGGGDLGGVEADSSRNLWIENNSFEGDIAVGIELMMSTNATVSGNTAVGSLGDGLALWNVAGFVEADNTLNGDVLGLRIENSTAGTIEANVVANCTWSFRLMTSSNLTFVHNSFEYDRNWTIAAGSRDLRWDGGYPVGGNYWSNASGADNRSGPGQNLSGADGILDTPFAIVGFGADRYPLAVPWESPSIVVVAKGLPAGTVWSVRLALGGFGTGSATLATNGSEITWAIPYAAWVPVTYRVGLVPGYVPTSRSGQLTTGSGEVTLTLNFVPYTLPVTFVEVGLANGTNWSVTIGGTSVTGNGTSLSLTLANGSYVYAPASIPGYYRLAPGSFTLAGGALLVPVNFTEVDFLLEFVEFGLANGTTWQLTFDGQTQSSTLPALQFSVPNGSYDFRVAAITGYSLAQPNGSVTVRGNPVVIRLEFSPPPPAPPPAPPPPSHTLEYELAALAAVLAALAVAGWLRGYRRGRGDVRETTADAQEETPAEGAPEEPLDPLA